MTMGRQLLSIVMLVVGLSACQQTDTTIQVPLTPADDNRIHVFVSILPQAFFVEQIGGDKVVVDVLVQPGGNPATYEPTPKQMAALSAAWVFFRIGVPFEDTFMPKIGTSIPQLLIVDTRTGIKLRHIEEEPDDGHHAADGHHHEGDDPHIWLDPKLVMIQAGTIRDTLSRLDPDNADVYRRNCIGFIRKLEQLHARLSTTLKPLRGKELFVYHPAYGYFADAYGLRQVAVETGGKEPSARQLSQLIESAKNHGVRVIFVQPQFSTRMAQAVADAIDGAVVPLDPLPRNYLDSMEAMALAVEQAFVIDGEQSSAKKNQTEDGMGGIIFFQTQKLDQLKSFYIDEVGCSLWLEQGDCQIYRFANMLFGFCQREQAPLGGLVTFFYEQKEEVDRQYTKFKEIALAPPKENPKYHIYHFFARDPEGRMVEFQHFDDPIDWDFNSHR